ncbi:MAG: translation initiation factor IF-2 [Anaerolineae bacterium]
MAKKRDSTQTAEQEHITAEVNHDRTKAAPAGTGVQTIEIPDVITVRDLARLMGISPIDVIKELMANGIMTNINQPVDYETATIVAEDLGFTVRAETGEVAAEEAPPKPVIKKPVYDEEDLGKLQPRPPVVAILGHVDHGKTSLLDVIRQTDVVSTEAGGITQHIGAYQVSKDDRKITFIDTPGHEAFTAMRARGGQAADIAVLVIATDDGVMPQTTEALDHARAAQVPIIVALNKVDKANANPDRVMQQLSDIDLAPEDWGGDTVCVLTSAKEKTGIETLLEMILLVADLSDLRANPDRLASGVVIEGKLDRSRGPMATLLIQRGTLRVGDNVVVGDIYGRIRAMLDDKGERVEEALPSMPVAVLGLSDVPVAGDTFQVLEDERAARTLVEERAAAKAAIATTPIRAFTLDDLYAQIQAGQVKELNLILKTDMQGTMEAVTQSLEKLRSDQVKVNIIHQGVGNISESDVNLASASQGIVIGFNVQPDEAARLTAESERVDIRLYDVIYELIEEVEKALEGLLEPTYEEVLIGRAEVRAVFSIPRKGNVAGVHVSEGKVTRNAMARVLRNGDQIYEGKVASLKRFADDVREVAAGFECGVGLDGFGDFAEGDVIELYQQEIVK